MTFQSEHTGTPLLVNGRLARTLSQFQDACFEGYHHIGGLLPVFIAALWDSWIGRLDCMQAEIPRQPRVKQSELSRGRVCHEGETYFKIFQPFNILEILSAVLYFKCTRLKAWRVCTARY